MNVKESGESGAELMKYDAFVSYSRADSSIVHAIVAKLRENSFRFWMDVDGISSGEVFIQAIAGAISSSYAVVIFWSEHSSHSSWINNEIELAIQRRKVIIPVLIDDSDPAEVFPEFKVLQYVVCRHSEQIDVCVERIKSILDTVQRPQLLQENDSKAYDVFISSKSSDYDFAEKVREFLHENGLSVFLASKEIRRVGKAEYAAVIDEAIDKSKHMIVVATSLANIKSQWVKYEWSVFSNDLKSGYRDGNLLTILSSHVQLQGLPASLRHQQSYTFDNYQDNILCFLKSDKNGLYYSVKEEAEKTSLGKSDTPVIQPDRDSSLFRIYSNESCRIILEGRTLGVIDGMADKPYCLPVPRKGDYRLTAINVITGEAKIVCEHIDLREEKTIELNWEGRKPFVPDKEWPVSPIISGDHYRVAVGNFCFEMIRVEGGKMMIGATPEQKEDAAKNEYPVHEIDMPTFYIGQFPVTQNLWELVMGYSKAHFNETGVCHSSVATGAAVGSALCPGIGTLIGAVVGWAGGICTERQMSDYGHLPAESLSYDEACEFVRRLSCMTNIRFALPTEEEWEYAARGGQKCKGFKYSGSNDIEKIAWYRENSNGMTHPVGQKMPNELGIYDMSGNVWEWTETLAHSYGTNVIPKGDCFVRRGGSWWHEAKNCRVSRRYASDRSKKTSGLGMRLVIRDNIE